MAQDAIELNEPAKAVWYNDPKVRSIVTQIVILLLLAYGIYWIVTNTLANLARLHIPTGFAFLGGRAGFDIPDHLIGYTSDSTYLDAIVVGLLNTILVAVCGIITATIIGFLLGIARLSNNWLLRKLATVYVETFRNIPPLLVIFFLYLAVLAVLPVFKESINLPFGSYLNNRGFYFPKPIWGEGSWLGLVGLILGIVFSFFVRRWAAARQMATGQQFPVFWTCVALIIGMPLLGLLFAGFPVTIDFPKASNFNMTGGINLKPEFLSLYLALSLYTASFIAEIVRAGIMGVPKGQTEAYSALGLSRGQGLRLVVIPQAMRIIIPPLTSQYLNLTKNSSLAVAIGYSDLYAIGSTVSNQSGQAIEIVCIFGVIYLGLSIATSLFMNWFNGRMALTER